MTITVGIVGMGRIAAGFDQPDDDAIRTHLKAVVADPRFSLSAVADLDHERARSELSRYGLDAAVISPTELLETGFDVLCIASPDQTHAGYAEIALGHAAEAVVCEKPLNVDGVVRQRLVTQADEQDRTLVLSHPRRWLPNLEASARQARSGMFGAPISATVHYGRGFRHNGIHATDIAAAFLGTNVLEAQEISEPIGDFSTDDPSLSILARLRTGGGVVPLVMHVVDGRKQTAFEIDIRFEGARFRILDDFWSRFDVYGLEGSDYPGFSPELTVKSSYVDDPPSLIGRMWSNLADHLTSGDTMICSGGSAMEGYDLADGIKECLRR